NGTAPAATASARRDAPAPQAATVSPTASAPQAAPACAAAAAGQEPSAGACSGSEERVAADAIPALDKPRLIGRYQASSRISSRSSLPRTLRGLVAIGPVPSQLAAIFGRSSFFN